MRARAALLAAALLGLAAPALRAQQSDVPISPGMTEAQVIERWGEPVVARRSGDWSYLFYRNGRQDDPRTYDLVILQGGQVVDAIVRAPGRAYTGVSSSPIGRLPAFTPPRRAAAATPAGAVTGVRVNPPTPYP